MSPTRRSSTAPKKSLGQHFLRDLGAIRDIAAAAGPGDGVPIVEIGPGTGALTEELLAKGAEVRAVEIDARMVEHLRRRFKRQPRFTVIQGDARDVDLDGLAAPGEPYRVAANLPYFAANPIIRRFLEAPHPPELMVVMVQREVAREVAAPDGDFSLLTIGTRMYAEAELLFSVPPEAFDPPPKVHSTVVRLTLRPTPLVPRERIEPFMRLVSRTFRNPRKQLHNALSGATHLGIEEARQLIEAAGIDSTRRPENLGFAEWLTLLGLVEQSASAVPGAPALPLPFPVLSGPAPAKINLSLDILGPREDGYHELATVLQTLALAGEVRAGPAPGAHDTIAASGPFAEGTPLDDTNFALAALTALRALGVAVPPLAVHLVKRVPAAGGLGGGASDAATVLRLVQRALDLPDAIVARAAEQVGSDEPALLLGGTVLAEGRGERVTPLPGLPVHGVVLFLPGVQVERKTGRMFAARARIGAWDDGSATRRLTGLFAMAPHLTPGMLSNGFEPVIDALVPGLGALRHAIEQRIGEPVRLAGAGPALFWIGEPERAAAVAEAARGLDCAVVPTETAPSPWLS